MLINTCIRTLVIVLLNAGAALPIAAAAGAAHVGVPDVTAANWERHPRIVEIRTIYREIQSKLAAKQLRYQKKDYTVLPDACRGTYPVEYLALATDREGHVRIYTTAQRISHGDLLTTRNYYDIGGRLRFVYMTNESTGLATIEHRVYLDKQGKVFWDVRTEAGKTAYGEITQDPWMINSTTNEGIRAKFERAEITCRE